MAACQVRAASDRRTKRHGKPRVPSTNGSFQQCKMARMPQVEENGGKQGKAGWMEEQVGRTEYDVDQALLVVSWDKGNPRRKSLL